MKIIKTSNPQEIEWLEKKFTAIATEIVPGEKKGEQIAVKSFEVEEDVILPDYSEPETTTKKKKK